MHLLEKRLAACIQIFPIRSFYRWKGRIEKGKEYLCLIKTRAKNFNDVKSEIRRIHPYSIPEILSFAVDDGNEEYLDWLLEETSTSKSI